MKILRIINKSGMNDSIYYVKITPFCIKQMSSSDVITTLASGDLKTEYREIDYSSLTDEGRNALEYLLNKDPTVNLNAIFESLFSLGDKFEKT